MFYSLSRVVSNFQSFNLVYLVNSRLMTTMAFRGEIFLLVIFNCISVGMCTGPIGQNHLSTPETFLKNNERWLNG